MILPVKTSGGSYDIMLCRGALNRVGEIFELDRRVLIVTDSGVPYEYAEKVAENCKTPFIFILKEGEASKNFDNFKAILEMLLQNDFTRSDCVVAVGGGVVGDISGFAASCYMRGIDFYNIPTTVLSMVDSSVGGKTAIDFSGVKNTVGAFYPPKAVLIDTETLKTLPDRQISNGLSESVKMAVTFDSALFELFEKENIGENIEKIIEKSLKIKISVVEADEKEKGLRRVLNFGHTIGHGIESAENGRLYHGECVAVGMLPMCKDKVVRERVKSVLCKLNLPTKSEVPLDKIKEYICHDKKLSGEKITVVLTKEIGTFYTETMALDEFLKGLCEEAVI